MKITQLKALALALGVLALPLTACGGSSSSQAPTVSLVGVSASFLGFGDDVTFEVTANRNDASGTYASGQVTVSTAGSSTIPATGSASIADVPFGNYDFTVDVYEGGALSFSKTYDNSGTGYEIDSIEESFELNVALGDGDSLTGIVSEFYSTVNVTLNFDFPPEVTLNTDDIVLSADLDGADGDDYVSAQLANNTITFTDYEDASAGDTDGIDLCSSGDANDIDLAFSVKTAGGTSCDVTSAVKENVKYESAGAYTATSCGGIVDCCRFEAKITEADLSACSSTTLTDYQYFVIGVTGTDSSENSASATVNVQITE